MPRHTPPRLAALLCWTVLLGACQRGPRSAPLRDAAAVPQTAAVRSAAAPPLRRPGFHRGVSLGLFSEDPQFSYRPLLQEIKDLGADHVALVAAYYQQDGRSTTITEHPRFSAPPATLLRAIRDARAVGLEALVFPIIRLSEPAAGEWRGTLKPADPARWWASYRSLVTRLARLSAAAGATALSVGSELSTLDRERAPWAALVAEVRGLFPGTLTYSGNWDHYQEVALYDLVDLLGVCGYFPLSRRGKASSDAELVAAWRDRQAELLALAQRRQRPLLFTELGYLSQRGATAWPWEEGAHEPVDLEEQRRAYAAFAAVWGSEPSLAGVYYWNWYGWGGPTSPGYTPRGKPAADEVRRFFARP